MNIYFVFKKKQQTRNKRKMDLSSLQSVLILTYAYDRVLTLLGSKHIYRIEHFEDIVKHYGHVLEGHSSHTELMFASLQKLCNGIDCHGLVNNTILSFFLPSRLEYTEDRKGFKIVDEGGQGDMLLKMLKTYPLSQLDLVDNPPKLPDLIQPLSVNDNGYTGKLMYNMGLILYKRLVIFQAFLLVHKYNPFHPTGIVPEMNEPLPPSIRNYTSIESMLEAALFEFLGHKCLHCNGTTKFLGSCAKCKRATYCSKECLTGHYEQHKLTCGQTQTLIE